MIDAQERNKFLHCSDNRRIAIDIAWHLLNRQFGNVRMTSLPLIKFGEKEAELIADDFGFILWFSVRYAFAVYMN